MWRTSAGVTFRDQNRLQLTIRIRSGRLPARRSRARWMTAWSRLSLLRVGLSPERGTGDTSEGRWPPLSTRSAVPSGCSAMVTGVPLRRGWSRRWRWRDGWMRQWQSVIASSPSSVRAAPWRLRAPRSTCSWLTLLRLRRGGRRPACILTLRRGCLRQTRSRRLLPARRSLRPRWRSPDDVDAARCLAESVLTSGDAGPDVCCHALELVGRSQRITDLDAARQTFERALSIADAAHLQIWRLHALHELGTIEMFDHAGTGRLFEARRTADDLGALSTAAVLDLQLSAAFVFRFALDDAAEHARAALAISERLGMGQIRAIALVFLGEIFGLRQEPAEMERFFALAASAAPGDPEIEGSAWGGGRAMMALLGGDRAGAIDALGRGVSLLNTLPQQGPALDATRGVIAGVRQGQWAAPTPCPGWDVRALVNHVVAGNLQAAELAAGATISEVGDHLDGDLLGADPLGAYDASAKAAAAVFAIPGRAQGAVRCLLRSGPWRGIRRPLFHRRAHPRLGRGRRHQAGYEAPPCAGECVPRHRRPSSGAPARQRRVR